MRNDLTDFTLVIDRSGSMSAIKDDAEGGINSFIEQQKQQPGEAKLTLVQFDKEYDFVHKGTPISDVSPYHLVPRGSTALLDAVGRAINETGQRLAAMNENDRPGLVLFVIVTDGQENSSHEFTKAQIKEMIERQELVYKWHFNFLAANQDAFAEAGAMGITSAGTANWKSENIGKVYAAMSKKAARMRTETSELGAACNAFTDEEREKMG